MEIVGLKKLEFKLAVGGNTWVLNNWGVVGLGPKSKFVQYVHDAFGSDNGFSIGLFYKTMNKTRKEEIL